MSVGSAEACDIHLKERSVSRLHAELELRDDGVWVRDLGSRNGTFIHDVRVEVARLPSVATMRFGNLRVELVEVQRPASLTLWSHDSFGPLLGRSLKMRSCFALLAQASASDASVLLEGETGVGKDIVARAIHEASLRASGPFIVVDCGALPENLLEAELFGHAKGAFTGAAQARAGAFEAASGGTFFLDEIGELPLAMQPKLLRALESRTIRRIGETAYRPFDARIIAATHRDLRKLVNQEVFREDLFFRLAVLPLKVPPLRERKEDIPLLLERFLGSPPEGFIGVEALARLSLRRFRGNVRELRNFAERVKVVGAVRALELLRNDDLSEKVVEEGLYGPTKDDAVDVSRESFDDHRDRAERRYLEALLAEHGSNISQAAKVARLARSQLYRLMHRWKL